jgi:uncharacterized protein (DUF924 family)
MAREAFVDRHDDVLNFWFPPVAPDDSAAMARQLQWWFRGGADAEINRRFRALHERGARGQLDDWVDNPRSRLALILVLDQFRTVYRTATRGHTLDPARS